eukprot:gnl/MRDRNA2_/MRDRNA2_82724_c0_seq1.p1 gnl/MRDRNA2_/MRDRNA2_82724_c0~~gnl/MRDRNA2_/MRDRNA2_82724_c0_seq1.p1  ORF type:complete len:111 (+),score=3.42 gnl/MRDRNA2_/MRDRNA2_82724_c0_seq1:27-359(+)
MMLRACCAIASIRGWSITASLANDHEVFASSCGTNSEIRAIAAAEIACSRGGCIIPSTAKAQDVFDKPCVTNSRIIGIAAYDIESRRVSFSQEKVAHDHAVSDKFYGLYS